MMRRHPLHPRLGFRRSGGYVTPEPDDGYQRIVFIGDSLPAHMFGNSLTEPAEGVAGMIDIPVFSSTQNGQTIANLHQRSADALAAYPVPGETLFVLMVGGNNITASLEYADRSPGEIQAIRDDLNDFLDLFTGHLDHVIGVQPSFRSYWTRGYSEQEIFYAEEKGAKPFNDNIFTPIYQERLNQRFYYDDGESLFCWYDLTRNNAHLWLQADGIHLATMAATRSVFFGRLVEFLGGTMPERVVPETEWPVHAPPTWAVRPVATGIAQVGETLTADTGEWNGSLPMTFTRRWWYSADGDSWSTYSPKRGTASITLTADDVGLYISPAIRAANEYGTSPWSQGNILGPVTAEQEGE